LSAFTQAAAAVLRDEQRPLTPEEITNLAVARGYLRTSGLTPSQTMKAKLSTSVLKGGRTGQFMRTDPGRFALRSWAGPQMREYVAKRYAKALLQEDAVVFPATSISRYVPGAGLHEIRGNVYASLVGECTALLRREAETRYDVIQLVSGFVVQFQGEVLTYRRTRRLPESRLHGEYSAIFGGHLNPEDLPVFNFLEPGQESFMDRELSEELLLPKDGYQMKFRGLLYDDSRDVSRQHLAIVYDVILNANEYTVGERGFLQQDQFESWAHVGARLGEFENWSQLLYRVYADPRTLPINQ
jgi:predicted NUDIX family phosphoesterase